MILTKLHLENFKKQKSYEIEFGEGLIGIVGKNGSGKSTIFEAILFALYGEFKQRGYKETIRHTNSSTKEPIIVELEFEFDTICYKVRRELRGKMMSAKASFLKNSELISTGVKEVTQSVIELTKMSKEAFLHTLFASQKELTSLSNLKNEDRKKMIRKLLGLEKIDFIEKELILRSRELKRDIGSFSEVLLSDEDIELKNKQIQDFQITKEEQEKILKEDSKELEQLKTQEMDVKNSLKILNKTKEDKQKLFSKIELIKNSITNQTTNKESILKELTNLELKKSELKELKHIKTDYLELQKQLKEQDNLKECFLRLEGLKKEQVQLKEQSKKSKMEIENLEKDSEILENINLEFKKLDKDLAEITKEILEQQELENKISSEISSEKKMIKDIDTKISTLEKLGKDSPCPTCTRILLDEYDNVINSLKSIVEDTHKKNLITLKAKLETVKTEKEKLELHKKQLDKELKEVSTKIALIRNKQDSLTKEKNYFKQLEEKNLKNTQEILKLTQYNYNEELHKNIKKEYIDLEPKYQYVLSLETVLDRENELKVKLQQIEKDLVELNDSKLTKDKEYNEIKYDSLEHQEEEKKHLELQKEKEDKTTKINNIRISITKIDGDIKVIKSTLIENSKQLSKVEIKKEDLKEYEKIKLSLSEFKTNLNEKITPRISAKASSMYSQITKGKYQHIEVDNEFDFFIYEDGKKYPIERFSGGEIDLANLVLRIAISKTLTELNGATSMGFLAFDEVFGSQDETRRVEILDIFHTIKEQYRQIFLITHEIEMKDMFESLIEL